MSKRAKCSQARFEKQHATKQPGIFHSQCRFNHTPQKNKTYRWVFGRFSPLFPKKTPIEGDLFQIPLNINYN
jgi:hypothetical protein